ncbi:MAG: LON peptidase substrate-binding domain-containing protein [Cyanobacteria bacterium NC_groundwater_1444_Ag_S-0.65um_54_12]|nr:LON peptidase substrate-binding domain-containing protein [Cyanobacteria bacterium NC_groundwater_1444_Ag_S-0.65um_54_12]
MPEQLIVPFLPLEVVLFPGMELSLHICETRYHLMIAYCLESSRHFAVGLARTSHREEGIERAASPTGTLAELMAVTIQPGGRMSVSIKGGARYRLLDMLPTETYAKARIMLLDHNDPVVPTDLVRAQELYLAYTEVLLALADMKVPDLPSDPVAVSYTIANLIQTDIITKQSLLELPGPRERIAEEVRLLEKEICRLKSLRVMLGERAYFFYRGRKLSLN